MEPKEIKIKLDPRIIVGELSNNSPIFLVEYMAKFCKIKFNKVYFNLDSYYHDLITSINNFDYPSFFSSISLTESELSKIIKFISPNSNDTKWYSKSIILGYKHMISFDRSNSEIPEFNIEKLTFGEKTSENPYNFNECIVFRIANFYNYNINKTTSFNELCQFIKKNDPSKISSIKNSLLYTINGMNSSDLLKILYQISNDTEIDDVEHFSIVPNSSITSFELNSNILQLTFDYLGDKKKLLCRIKATSHYEAIIISALNFGINIVGSSLPLKELENLTLNRRYIPYCTMFSKKYNINKKWYNISETWCEELSPYIYSLEQLKNFAINEGFENVDDYSTLDLHTCLKNSRNSFNFYFGFNPECECEDTIIYKTIINEIDSDELICCGNIKTKELYYITISELKSYFENTKMYLEPKDSINICDRSIKKLRNFCLKRDIKYQGMLNVLDDLDFAKKLIDTKVKDLKITINRLPVEERNKVENFFNKVIEMGLYMRGYKIDNDILPLASEDTFYENNENDENNENQRNVIKNTVTAHEEAKEILSTLGKHLIEDIKCLHILMFDRKGKTTSMFGFKMKSTNIYRETTLLDCMNKIYGGYNNIYSCMRTNSNWILYSAVWYCMLFGFDVGFRIDEIDDIR
jgi:hypothetical protein